MADIYLQAQGYTTQFQLIFKKIPSPITSSRNIGSSRVLYFLIGCSQFPSLYPLKIQSYHTCFATWVMKKKKKGFNSVSPKSKQLFLFLISRYPDCFKTHIVIFIPVFLISRLFCFKTHKIPTLLDVMFLGMELVMGCPVGRVRITKELFCCLVHPNWGPRDEWYCYNQLMMFNPTQLCSLIDLKRTFKLI